MVFLLFWIGFSIVVGMFAKNYRGRDFGTWFAVSLLFSPLLGFLFCAASLPQAPLPPMVKLQQRSNNLKFGLFILLFIVTVVGIGLLIGGVSS